MAELSVHLLGPPEVRSKGQRFSILRRFPRALLFYLASQGFLVGRETLLTLFWENEADETARRRLRETLSRLRAALPDPGLLISEGDLVGLDLDRVYVDQVDFQDLIDRAGRLPWQIPPEEPLPEEVIENLSRAIHLWRGTLFMEGADLPSSTSLDEWLTHTNQHLTHLRGRVLERLADHARASGDLEAALGLARTALASDSLNEDLHYRVLSFLIVMGRKQEAREYFQYLQGLLQREQELPPSPRLVALYRQIRPPIPLPFSTPKAAWRTWSSLEIPLVGREAAMAKMSAALDQGGGLVVLGESGQGKTRLVQEFCRTLATDRRILLMHCRQAESVLPFQPFIELFRNNLYPEEWLSLPSNWAGRLALLLPELLVMRPELEPALAPSDPAHSSALLYEAIRQVMLILAQESPVILFLDDAHWADEASLAAVAYLLERSPFDRQALLILATRREEANPNLEELLSTAQSASMFRSIQLSRLSVDEITHCGSYVLGTLPGLQFIHHLAKETGGNPLFILETLRALKERRIHPGELSRGGLPMVESIQTLIRSRLRRLTPEAREVLETAGILGNEFNPEVISQVNGKSLAEIGAALDELEKRMLVEALSTPPQPMRYGFIHDKFRELILEELNPVRATLLHRRVAQILVANPGLELERRAAVLAQHFEAGGEPAKAFQYWLEAGEHARQLYSTRDAERIFKHAERLIELAGEQLSIELIHRLYSEWTEVAFAVDDATGIQMQNTNLLQLGRRRNSPLLIGAALDGLGDACLARNEFAEGLAFATQAVTYLEKSGNVYEQMDAYTHQGVFFYMLSRLPEAIEAFQEALALGIGSQDPRILKARSNAHYQTSLVRTLEGNPESGRDHALRALEEGFVQGYRTPVQGYIKLSLSRYFLGEFEQARQDNQTGIDLAQRTEEARMLGYLHAVRGMIEYSLGELDESFKHAETAISLGEMLQHTELISMGYRVLGDLSMLIEATEKAAVDYQRGMQVPDKGFWTLDNTYRYGFALAWSGEVDLGIAYLNQAIEEAKASGIEVSVFLAQLFLGYVYVNLEEWEKVRLLATSLESATYWRKLRFIHLLSKSLLGIAAQNTGDLPLALTHHQAAVQEATELNAPIHEI